MPFAQLVVGSPGSGKSTYCDGSKSCCANKISRCWKANVTQSVVHQFMGAIGRACSVVNLDPANDHTNYPVALDIRSLIKLEDIMRDDKLGPNGAILYALEELEHNFEWLEEGLKEFDQDYLLFDCPGQVELYTHHNSLRNIFYKLQKLGFRVGANIDFLGRSANEVHIVCGSPPIRLNMPHPTFVIHFKRLIIPSRHDTDGHATCECPVQNRQGVILR